MKENESSEKKTSVKFDESQNTIKEFRKGDKIAKADHSRNGQVKFKENDNSRPTKLRKTSDDGAK